MSDDFQSTDVSQETVGQIFKNARETKQISITEVAQRLLLSKKIVAAIEEDDYSMIPAQVYAEGYVKAYANFLQIPIDTALGNFRCLNIYSVPKAKTEPKVRIQASKFKKLPELLKGRFNKGRFNRRIIWGFVVAIVLGATGFFVGKLFIGGGAEIINVPNVLSASSEVLSDNQVNESKAKPSEAKKSNSKTISLMLDTSSSKAKPKNNHGEPNLVLTKPEK